MDLRGTGGPNRMKFKPLLTGKRTEIPLQRQMTCTREQFKGGKVRLSEITKESPEG